jgi:hypothetical protein
VLESAVMGHEMNLAPSKLATRPYCLCSVRVFSQLCTVQKVVCVVLEVNNGRLSISAARGHHCNWQ